MGKAIVVVVGVLTAGWYFGSNVNWWLWKVLLFGIIRAELSLRHLFRNSPLAVQNKWIVLRFIFN
jgi:hypothetical protein